MTITGNPVAATVLLYGATGYTGQLIAELAAASGVRPILAGRDQAGVEALAKRLGLPARSFALEDAAAVQQGLAGVSVVLHCAGPFARTSAPMASACLAAGVHYLDITGEIEVFEQLAARDAEARSAGVMLLPGVGFDVVPSDCLAAHLARQLPGATHLMLALGGGGRLSRGTLTTMIENQHRGGMVRRGGKLVSVPAAWRTRTIDFGRGPRTAVTIPWGDVSTAWYSTGIPDIEVYVALPAMVRGAMVASRYLGWILGSRWIRDLQLKRIRQGPPGPTAEQLERGRSTIWGRVEDAAGRSSSALLRGPDGYLLTARTALAVVRRVLDGDAPPGFQTPSRAYGPDFVLTIEGVSREELA